MACHENDIPCQMPCEFKLQSPLSLGQTINVHGEVKEDAKRAELNLMMTAMEIGPGSAVLHLALRFDEGKIVLNSYLNGEWGKEERVSLKLKPGDKYDLRVRAEEENYSVRVNGVEAAKYKHRIPFSSTEFLQLKGDVSCGGMHIYGQPYVIPLRTVFANGHLKAGQKVDMYAIMKGDQFHLDFVGANGDALFHFNPRLGEKTVIRNSQKDQVWQHEEREGPFPFHKDVGFNLNIVNESYSMQIFVDNKHIGAFAHRCDPEQDYKELHIEGDVEITAIQFRD